MDCDDGDDGDEGDDDDDQDDNDDLLKRVREVSVEVALARR